MWIRLLQNEFVIVLFDLDDYYKRWVIFGILNKECYSWVFDEKFSWAFLELLKLFFN
jgi:hypothetical protein